MALSKFKATDRWLKDKDCELGYRMVELVTDNNGMNMATVRIDRNHKEVSKADLYKIDYLCDHNNLADLAEATEPNVLFTLLVRYKSNKIYVSTLYLKPK